MSGFEDDELRAMLEARASRAAIDPAPLIAEARARALEASRAGSTRLRIGRVPAVLGGLAMLAAVVAVLAVPLALRPASSPAPSDGPSQASPPPASNATSPPPSTTSGAEADRYPGGIPRTIDGEPVLVGFDSLLRWKDGTDAAPFLVGGWLDGGRGDDCYGGPIVFDPHPLAQGQCARYRVDGIFGLTFYRETFIMPKVDGPVVLRVHTHDPDAEMCWPEYLDRCRMRAVVESVTWVGDDDTVAVPIGPQEARRRTTSLQVMERRDMPNGSQITVDEDVFTVPIVCPAPWPTLLFSIHGDPRYGVLAVFPDTAARERFEAEMDPSAGTACLGIDIERPAEPRWVGHENIAVLTFGDDAFVTRLGEVLVDPQREQVALDLVDPALDRGLETVNDYLVARASAELGHAIGERLIPDFLEPDTEVDNAYGGWDADVFRRYAASALVGDIEPLDDDVTEARVGPNAWRFVSDPGVTRSRIFRVTYPGATDPALATEEFVAIQTPESTFRDWQLVRIAGAPYPVVPQVATPSTSSGGDAISTDPLCLPAGEPCGP
jgi:hypothetical protein